MTCRDGFRKVSAAVVPRQSFRGICCGLPRHPAACRSMTWALPCHLAGTAVALPRKRQTTCVARGDISAAVYDTNTGKLLYNQHRLERETDLQHCDWFPIQSWTETHLAIIGSRVRRRVACAFHPNGDFAKWFHCSSSSSCSTGSAGIETDTRTHGSLSLST